MSVGTNIKRLRLDAGLTQEELAQKLGVARSTVTQWERGWTQPRMGMVHKLAMFFCTTNSAIVQEDDQDKSAVVVVPSADIPIDVEPGDCGQCDQPYLAVPSPILEAHPLARCVIVEKDSVDRVLPKGFGPAMQNEERVQWWR